MEEFPIIPNPPADGFYCDIYNCNTFNYETNEQAPVYQPGFPASNFYFRDTGNILIPSIDTSEACESQEMVARFFNQKFKVDGEVHNGPLYFSGTEVFIHFQSPRVDILNNVQGFSGDDWMKTRIMNIIKDGIFESVKFNLMKGPSGCSYPDQAASFGQEKLASGFMDIANGNAILRVPGFVLYPGEYIHLFADIFYRSEAVYLIKQCEVGSNWFVNSEDFNYRIYFESSVKAIVHVQEPEYVNPDIFDRGE